VRQFWQAGVCEEPGELCTAFPPFMWVLPSLHDSLCDLPSASSNLDSQRTRAIKGGWRVERRRKLQCAADMSHDATHRGILTDLLISSRKQIIQASRVPEKGALKFWAIK